MKDPVHPETYIIAEIGINHNADMDILYKLIDIAAFAGCDAVKFQKRNPDVCVPEDQKDVMRDTPWGRMTYLDYKHYMEFTEHQYKHIAFYCESRKIDWSASVWDQDSLEFMTQFERTWIKIPSAKITDTDLILNACRLYDKVIISTGMSTEGEIDAAASTLHQNAKHGVIMHCNSAYPARVDDLNLLRLGTFKEKYPALELGYSGHEFGLIPTVVATTMGATVIERHITLDRTMWGTDQMASVEPHGLIKLVKDIREVNRALGSPDIYVTDAELEPRKKLRG